MGAPPEQTLRDRPTALLMRRSLPRHLHHHQARRYRSHARSRRRPNLNSRQSRKRVRCTGSTRAGAPYLTQDSLSPFFAKHPSAQRTRLSRGPKTLCSETHLRPQRACHEPPADVGIVISPSGRPVHIKNESKPSSNGWIYLVGSDGTSYPLLQAVLDSQPTSRDNGRRPP